MNAALRRISTVAFVMLMVLMVAATWIQVAEAPDLNADNRNVRTMYREYGNSRGSIIVDGDSVAISSPSDDAFGFQRSYSDGPLYAPLTGFYSIVFGRTAIEDTENLVLNGSADSLFITRLQDLITGRQPKGSSVELTVSAAVQEAAWEALGDQRGAVVALDPKTGAILGMVSKPSFDPNRLASHNTVKVNDAYQTLLNDDADPLINRALSTTYPPGSTFKLLVAAAALESGDYEPDSVIAAPQQLQLPQSNSILGNFGGVACSPSDEMTLAQALTISCNTAFAQLGMDLGEAPLSDTATAFGFSSRFEVPMRSVASNFPTDLGPAEIALSSIGQASVTTTPLQMATIAATIGNNGTQMAPYSVQTVRNPDLEPISETSPEELGKPISIGTADALTAMMVDVVKSGSGRAAAISGVEVAGKTGTAQTTDEAAPHAWFVGFAPADDPQIAVAVIVEHGGSLGSEATGGAVAAPIARAVLQAGLK